MSSILLSKIWILNCTKYNSAFVCYGCETLSLLKKAVRNIRNMMEYSPMCWWVKIAVRIVGNERYLNVVIKWTVLKLLPYICNHPPNYASVVSIFWTIEKSPAPTEIWFPNFLFRRPVAIPTEPSPFPTTLNRIAHLIHFFV